METLKTITMEMNRVKRDREVDLGDYCEHLPLNCRKYIINSDGRKVCSECCDHTEALTGIFQWNGLTYCVHCCKHNFRHKNFVEHLGDGLSTCTMCWTVIGQYISMGCDPRLGKGKRKRKPILPKTTLTNCDGKSGRIRYR